MIQVTGTIEKPNRVTGVALYTNPLINISFASNNKFNNLIITTEIGLLITDSEDNKQFSSEVQLESFEYIKKNPSFTEIQLFVKSELEKIYKDITFEIV